MTDWVDWHAGYEDPESPLAKRLAVVRELLGDAVASRHARRLRVLGICAGDGRDVLPVLATWRGRKQISGRLIELQPRLAERAHSTAQEEGLDGIEVVCADAAQPSNYLGAVPADLVVLCGVFGNISDEDVHRLIEALPALCARCANVVWTRHRRHPDLTPRIRAWLASSGFDERAFSSPGPDQFAVGRHRLVIAPRQTTLRDPLFAFVR